MTKHQNGIELIPIGVVKNQITLRGPKYFDNKDMVSEIVIDQEFKPGLMKLEEFSHVIILYALHLIPEKEHKILHIHPRSRADLPLVGIFATRSPARPNSIGMTVVKLLKIENNILSVLGLDAINGSPVLDIKPYIPEGDSVSNPKYPDWINKL